MLTYLVRRLALIVFVAVGVSTLLFVLVRLSGDAAALMAPADASPEVIASTRARFGLDQPLAVQYLNTVTANFTLDFGQSFMFSLPASQMVFERLGPSLWIVLPPLVISLLGALSIGIYASLRPSRLSGRSLMVVTFLFDGVPYFWLAMLLVLVFSINLQWLPATGNAGFSALVIPWTVLSIYGLATLSRLTRGQLLDAFTEGHVITARSKGLSPARVLLLHALPTALPPVLAWLGIQFSLMFSALLILEPLLNYNGLGALLVGSVSNRDFPVIQASVFSLAVLITVMNILMDTIVRTVDPRLRTKAAH
ncbi:ABC transporter permease [Nocardiopsis quinghaiensis]|uniref:ABC transporter permease n=1 Tax=Nocardiopsis quinghaiensis TaxID=464995 RepID=UPI00123A7896|nr:ABC transporter permease [Nocardiopsis quinghaiensis]